MSIALIQISFLFSAIANRSHFNFFALCRHKTLFHEQSISCRIRPSFREGPRSPTHRRSLTERRSSLGAVEENADLARKEQEYEKTVASLRSRKLVE